MREGAGSATCRFQCGGALFEGVLVHFHHWREWQGVEQIVTVTADGFEWQGRPYKSLSAIARAITGTRWNGWVFFGLKNHRGRK